MLPEDRYQRIRTLLSAYHSLSSDRIAGELNVSRETVRRDVLELEARGELRRVHGGVVAVNPEPEPPLAVRASVRQKEKRAIAKAAARLVRPGQTLFLDAGSTVSALAEELTLIAGITIITNSFDIATRLSWHDASRPAPPGQEIIQLGGRPGSAIAATYGAITIGEIGRYRADLALLSPVALSLHHGATSFDLAEAEVARAMVRHADHLVLLADHSKIGQTSRVSFCPADGIGTLVTDAQSRDLPALAGLEAVVGDVVIG